MDEVFLINDSGNYDGYNENFGFADDKEGVVEMVDLTDASPSEDCLDGLNTLTKLSPRFPDDTAEGQATTSSVSSSLGLYNFSTESINKDTTNKSAQSLDLKVSKEEQQQLKVLQKIQKEEERARKLQEKNREKEEKRIEKVRQKEERQLEKNRKIQETKIQREQQKAQGSDAEKYVTTLLDGGVSDKDIPGPSFETTFVSEFSKRGYKWSRSSNIVPSSIVWQKTTPLSIDGKRGESQDYADQIVIFVELTELLAMIRSDKLLAFLREKMDWLTDSGITNVTLVSVGLEQHLQSLKHNKAKVREMILRAQVQLQLECERVQSRLFNSTDDLVSFIVCVHKAVALQSQKQGKMTRYNYHLDGQITKVNALPEEPDVGGVKEWWLQMLLQVPRMAPEMARAIVANYAHPNTLRNAYAATDVVAAKALLQDIVIKMGDGRASTQKRLGPKMSERIHTFLTASDSETII